MNLGSGDDISTSTVSGRFRVVENPKGVQSR